MNLLPIHRQLLAAIVAEPGERCACELASDLGFGKADTSRAIQRLSEAGYLEPRTYRLVDEQRYIQRGWGCVGTVEDGNHMRQVREDDMEARIIVAVASAVDGVGRENLARLVGCSTNDGAFARALRWLVRHGLLYGADSPWPSEKGRGEVAQDERKMT